MDIATLRNTDERCEPDAQGCRFLRRSRQEPWYHSKSIHGFQMHNQIAARIIGIY